MTEVSTSTTVVDLQPTRHVSKLPTTKPTTPTTPTTTTTTPRPITTTNYRIVSSCKQIRDSTNSAASGEYIIRTVGGTILNKVCELVTKLACEYFITTGTN